MYDPDNPWYLMACFLNAAITAGAPAEDAESERYESASVVATVTYHARDITSVTNGLNQIICHHNIINKKLSYR